MSSERSPLTLKSLVSSGRFNLLKARHKSLPITDPIDQKAKRSNAPYMMAVYRQEGDGKVYRVVRNVYVPLIIGGKRWGDLELAYAL